MNPLEVLAGLVLVAILLAAGRLLLAFLGLFLWPFRNWKWKR